MFCSQCGNKLESDSVFCHSCGMKALQESPAVSLTVRMRSIIKQKYFFLIIGVLTMVIIIFSLQSVVGGGGNKLDDNLKPTSKEQKVLDLFLGTWKYEVTTYNESNSEEVHTTGTVAFKRILKGKFIQEISEDKSSSILSIATYDESELCYRRWSFMSIDGLYPLFSEETGHWNEATSTMEWSKINVDYDSYFQWHYFNDKNVTINSIGKNSDGNITYKQSGKLTRIKYI